MRKNSIIYSFILLVVGFCANAQVRIYGNSIPNEITNSSVFLDASTQFSQEAGMVNNYGKGIVIPSVDLVNFEFTSHADGVTFPTYYDGMIVYNRATGSTLTSGRRSSTVIAVKPGFYYYFNPTPTGSTDDAKVKTGVWRPLGDSLKGGNGTFVDNNGLLNVFDATAIQKGIVQLAGDLSGTAAAPTVPGLATKEPIITAGLSTQYFRGDKTWQLLDKSVVGLSNVDNTSDANKPISVAVLAALNTKEDVSNKSTSITTDAASTSKYPSVKVIKDYVDAQISSNAIPDATNLVKGKLQLAGDLAGTADAPTVPGLALKAPNDSPVFTGVPAAPTASSGTNTTQIATTAFVTSALNFKPVVSKTANYTATVADETILCDTATGGFTITLPSASNNTGKLFVIRKVDQSANVLSISPSVKVSETTSVASMNFTSSFRIQSNGSDWYVVQ
jgi:hypothetical protein